MLIFQPAPTKTKFRYLLESQSHASKVSHPESVDHFSDHSELVAELRRIFDWLAQKSGACWVLPVLLHAVSCAVLTDSRLWHNLQSTQ